MARPSENAVQGVQAIYKKTFHKVFGVESYGIIVTTDGYSMMWEYFTEQERDINWKEIIKKGAR